MGSVWTVYQERMKTKVHFEHSWGQGNSVAQTKLKGSCRRFYLYALSECEQIIVRVKHREFLLSPWFYL